MAKLGLMSEMRNLPGPVIGAHPHYAEPIPQIRSYPQASASIDIIAISASSTSPRDIVASIFCLLLKVTAQQFLSCFSNININSTIQPK